MTEDNVFQLGADYLLGAQEALRKLESDRAQLEESVATEKRARKTIAGEEKSIQEEIENTIKKRKEELAVSYDKQLDTLHGKTREVQAKRDRRKEKYMSERMAQETAEIKELNRKLLIEMKTMFKQERVPSYCGSFLYFSLYMPKRAADYAMLLFVILLAIVGVPVLLYVFLASKPALLAAAITLALTVEFLLYFIIFHMTKLRHYNAIVEASKIRGQMYANGKQMKAVKNSIAKDKDESAYDLSKYDEKLQELAQEAQQLGEKKQQALTEFEQNTKQLVTDEIVNRRMPKVQELKTKREQLERMIAQLEKRVQQESLEYTQKYAKYLGAGLSKAEGLDDLIAIMAEGSADTVGQAIAVYKGESE